MADSVFVTGAASGIGLEIVRRFARAGYAVGAVDIDEAGLAELKSEAVENDWSIWTSQMDVTEIAEWHDALDEFVSVADGRLDVLVNNAGILAAGRFVDIEPSRHKQIIDVNVTGVLLGCHAAFEYLRHTPGARVLNLCSASAIYGQPDLASYSASKFAVRGLTEALELEWERYDISVIALWPLFVDTAMVVGMDIGTVDSLGVRLTAAQVAEAAWQAVHRKSPIRKVHHPVGYQASFLFHLARFSPAWLNRLANKLLAR